VAGSVADTADETDCLPNFLRFCPATSAASSGQECPFIAFDRPYAVYPEIEQQVMHTACDCYLIDADYAYQAIVICKLMHL